MVQSLFGALQRGGVSIQSNVPTLRAVRMPGGTVALLCICLLYTSDAADE